MVTPMAMCFMIVTYFNLTLITLYMLPLIHWIIGNLITVNCHNIYLRESQEQENPS